MKLKTYLLAAGLLSSAFSSQAAILPVNLVVSDSEIRVGERFSINVTTAFDSLSEVTAFAFIVDPLNTFTSNGILRFDTWSVPSPFFSLESPPSNTVDGLGDPFDPVFGGNSVLLATLEFTALQHGMQTVAVEGLTQDFLGISLLDDTFSLLDYDIQASTSINVVPDSVNTLALLGLAAFGLGIARGQSKRVVAEL